ncbi:MAG: UvrD-helicase domain-containing protein [Chloroflexota bacterium]|nr:UvrD-helicase domain-containing protein [Chloroflexota bacterium]
MQGEWLWTPTPAFLSALRALPNKEEHQVLEKIKILEQDPAQDGKAKKKIKGWDDVYRLRCGDYRILYTYKDPYVSLLKLDRRDEDTYDDEVDATYLGGYAPAFDLRETPGQIKQLDLLAPLETESRALAEPITQELLSNLLIPAQYHTRLLAIQTEEELLNCSDVPQQPMEQLIDCIFPPSLAQIMQQPVFLIEDLDDLIRYKEGELIGFLLKLSPEQERFVSWAMRANGPTQVKGGPGTGKSTVALYRVRSILEKLRKQGMASSASPRILYTTYTNALVHSSEQLLQQLLGEDARFVEVQTADKKMSDILKRAGVPKKTPNENNHNLLHTMFHRSVRDAPFEGNPLQRLAQQQAIERLGHTYVQEEIHKILIARQIATFDAYLTARRPGRKVRLKEIEKQAIWCVYQTYTQRLKKVGAETWEQARVRAEALVVHDAEFQSFDAVVVDEAQDLDPALLRLLLQLSKSPSRFFITADANQSIYGSGFNWSDVHEALKFTGRTSVLRANYRSTREIGEATQSYLSSGILDDEQIEYKYTHNGPLPVMRAVQSREEETQLLVRFLRSAPRELRFSIGSCAVLCPSNDSGRVLAATLRAGGIEATFMEGKNLNLSWRGVKIITLNSAKGLEFPIVALAGFAGSHYTNLTLDRQDEKLEEELARLRRTIFVGMTRAMRALLVIVPLTSNTPLLQGFDPTYWNMSRK